MLYLSGQLRPIMIPEMPMFLIFNVALVRKGMDASHMGPGLTAADNFDESGKWKGMHMDIEYVRVYQHNTQGDTRGLNPPITCAARASCRRASPVLPLPDPWSLSLSPPAPPLALSEPLAMLGARAGTRRTRSCSPTA